MFTAPENLQQALCLATDKLNVPLLRNKPEPKPPPTLTTGNKPYNLPDAQVTKTEITRPPTHNQKTGIPGNTTIPTPRAPHSKVKHQRGKVCLKPRNPPEHPTLLLLHKTTHNPHERTIPTPDHNDSTTPHLNLHEPTILLPLALGQEIVPQVAITITPEALLRLFSLHDANSNYVRKTSHNLI